VLLPRERRPGWWCLGRPPEDADADDAEAPADGAAAGAASFGSEGWLCVAGDDDPYDGTGRRRRWLWLAPRVCEDADADDDDNE
jgi:hypothetical protein